VILRGLLPLPLSIEIDCGSEVDANICELAELPDVGTCSATGLDTGKENRVRMIISKVRRAKVFTSLAETALIYLFAKSGTIRASLYSE